MNYLQFHKYKHNLLHTFRKQSEGYSVTWSNDVPIGHAVCSSSSKKAIIIGTGLFNAETGDPISMSYEAQLGIMSVSGFHELAHIAQDNDYKNAFDYSLYEYIVQRTDSAFYMCNHDFFVRELEADYAGVMDTITYFSQGKFQNQFGKDFAKNLVRDYFEFKQDTPMYNGCYFDYVDYANMEITDDSLESMYINMRSKAMTRMNQVKSDGFIRLNAFDQSNSFYIYIKSRDSAPDRLPMNNIYNVCVNMNTNKERIQFLAANIVAFNEYVNDTKGQQVLPNFLDEYPLLKRQSDFIRLKDSAKSYLKTIQYPVSNIKIPKDNKTSKTISRGDVYTRRVAEVDGFDINDETDDRFDRFLQPVLDRADSIGVDKSKSDVGKKKKDGKMIFVDDNEDVDLQGKPISKEDYQELIKNLEALWEPNARTIETDISDDSQEETQDDSDFDLK